MLREELRVHVAIPVDGMRIRDEQVICVCDEYLELYKTFEKALLASLQPLDLRVRSLSEKIETPAPSHEVYTVANLR